MKNTQIVTTIVVLIIGLGGGFFAGMKYQEDKRSIFTQFGNSGNFAGNRNERGEARGRFGQAGGGAVAGDIISVDEKSITAKLADGSSKIILLSDKTTINKAGEATKDDLKTGTRVAAFGITNSDGSVTATNIQINPMFGGRIGGPTPTN